MTKKKSSTNTQDRVNKVIEQAKESLKMLRTFEKETLSKAKNLIHFPTAAERKKFTQKRILPGLKKFGIATLEEVLVLQEKLEKLEATFLSKDQHSGSHSHSKHASGE